MRGNEGKTFILKPLVQIYGEEAIFRSPSSSSFPLLGLERCSICIWDDWRFHSRIFGLAEQLRFYEGLPIQVARPQNQFTGHSIFHGSCPVFITGKLSDLEHPGAHPDDIAMLKKRLNTFCFSYVQQNPDRTIKPCGKCFSEFVLRPGFADVMPNPPAAVDVGAIVAEVVRQLRG